MVVYHDSLSIEPYNTSVPFQFEFQGSQIFDGWRKRADASSHKIMTVIQIPSIVNIKNDKWISGIDRKLLNTEN